jgi:hypothetical protein
LTVVCIMRSWQNSSFFVVLVGPKNLHQKDNLEYVIPVINHGFTSSKTTSSFFLIILNKKKCVKFSCKNLHFMIILQWHTLPYFYQKSLTEKKNFCFCRWCGCSFNLINYLKLISFCCFNRLSLFGSCFLHRFHIKSTCVLVFKY